MFLVSTPASCASRRPAFRAGSVAHGKLSAVANMWLLELDGTPAERGKAAGELLGEQVRWLLPRYLKQVASVKSLSPSQKERVAVLAAEIPRPYFEQLNAYAEAAKVDRTALFAVNMAPEVFSAFACSCLAVTPERSADGKVRLARNLDWLGADLLADAGLVIIESGGEHVFASFSWPGLVGVATGINDAGLVVADLMALHTGSRRVQPGVPVLFAVRAVLEQRDSVQEALAWLKSARRTLAQNYALADAAEARVVETSATRFEVRGLTSGLAAITNFWGEQRGGAKDERYARMMTLAGDSKLGVERLEHILGRLAIRGMNIQAVVLEPETRKAYVARGKPPVAAGKWQVIDLSGWLGREKAEP